MPRNRNKNRGPRARKGGQRKRQPLVQVRDADGDVIMGRIQPRNQAPRPRRRRNRNKGSMWDKVAAYGPAAVKNLGTLSKVLAGFVTGFGDYNVSSNTMMGMEPPEVINSPGSGSVIIRHREYLGDIEASEVFTNHTYTINPGDDQTFPWLSQIAQSFEQYRVRGMLFYFNSMSSPNVLAASATTALGTVIMATQYDVEDPPFASKMEMENYIYANSRVPYKSFIHPIECARGQTTLTELYIRDSQVNSGDTDARFYDLGKFNIATVGQQAAAGVIGELWVTYEIELFKPKLTAAPAVETRLTDNWVALTGITNSVPCGTDNTLEAGSNLGTSYSGSSRTFAFPENTEGEIIMVNFFWTGTSVATTLPSISYDGFGTIGVIDGGVIMNGGTTTSRLMYCATLQQLDATASITLGAAGTLPSSATLFQAIFTVLTSAFIPPLKLKDKIKIDCIEIENAKPLHDIEDTYEHYKEFMEYINSRKDSYHRVLPQDIGKTSKV